MQVKLYKILLLIIFSGLLNIFFISCKENNIQVNKIKGKQEEINQNLDSDSTFISVIEPYKVELQSKINTILCYNPRTLYRKENDLESSLGNLYADICFQIDDSIFNSKTGNRVDFALFNYGGIRTIIPKGEIRVKNVI
jgi:5'-nucleotidase